MLPDAPAVHLAETSGPGRAFASLHRARVLMFPRPRFELSCALPPGVMAAAPAACHRRPIAAVHAAYSRVFHASRVLQILELQALHDPESVHGRDLGTEPPEHKPACLATRKDAARAFDSG